MEPTTALITHYGVGGSLLYLQQLARAFDAEGYPMLYYLPRRTDIGIADRSGQRPVLKEPSLPHQFLRVKLLKYLHHLSKYAYNALAVRPAASVKVAHILFPFYLTDWVTTARLRRRALKTVLTVHEVFPHRSYLGEETDRRLLKALYKGVDMLSVHTRSLKETLVDAFGIDPLRIAVIPHGPFTYAGGAGEITALKEKYSLPKDRRILLFFGGIRRNKGLDVLLHAMAELSNEFILIVAGRIHEDHDSASRYYPGITEVNGSEGPVRWMLHHIPDHVVPELFRIADAVVLPYRRSFHAQSGVLNLAVGYGKPCVVSDVGGIGETVKQFGLGVVVEPENVAALREGIRSLCGDIDCSDGFEKHKLENSWETIARKYIAIYESLCA